MIIYSFFKQNKGLGIHGQPVAAELRAADRVRDRALSEEKPVKRTPDPSSDETFHIFPLAFSGFSAILKAEETTAHRG